MVKFKRRNTGAFILLAWLSLVIFTGLVLIGLYNLDEPLMVKGYYLMGTVGIITSSFTVAKVVRDNQEDLEDESEYKRNNVE
ncbi:MULTISPECIES: YiaA/YiaB family inner membrane protein [Metabacillus]|uniref:YiaAB two helix domain-containing protein n=1 Tax=Metabacillus rhizolycopersici TaxID=2875709 RepID=A0ABS7V008_9BACI|nr:MULTISPECIES: YiaA/YiaB family inner membrane protein [Metabacillus]MBZ5753915.1 hypothetical protein [Metabacillus rhizolycopersici]MCM3651919.1 hypothetical protein [Metabacillus litoralis]